MLLRKLGKRGTAIIEYVILLSFVAVIGTSFTSDSGMGGSIKSIITNVEQMLGLAAGKKSYTTVKRGPLVGEDAELLQNGVNAIVDGIYEAYLENDIAIRSFKIDDKGNIKDVTYWTENGEYATLPQGKYIEGNYNSFLEGTGCSFAKDKPGTNITELYYTQQGQLILPPGYNQQKANTDGRKPRIVISKDGNQYVIEGTSWAQDYAANNDNPLKVITKK